MLFRSTQTAVKILWVCDARGSALESSAIHCGAGIAAQRGNGRRELPADAVIECVNLDAEKVLSPGHPRRAPPLPWDSFGGLDRRKCAKGRDDNAPRPDGRQFPMLLGAEPTTLQHTEHLETFAHPPFGMGGMSSDETANTAGGINPLERLGADTIQLPDDARPSDQCQGDAVILERRRFLRRFCRLRGRGGCGEVACGMSVGVFLTLMRSSHEAPLRRQLQLPLVAVLADTYAILDDVSRSV
mgnify:CR=1 FL=1